MAGALAERDFVAKMERVGFREVRVLDRRPVSVDDFALYPLFTAELIHLMRTLIPEEQQGSVATSVVVLAVRPR